MFNAIAYARKEEFQMSATAEKRIPRSARAVKRLVVVPVRYGPPWREGVANLARRLVQNLREAGDAVVVLTPGPSNGESRGEYGERVVRIGDGSLTVLERVAFWTRVTGHFFRAREGDTSSFVFTSLSNSTPIRLRALNHAIGGRMMVYVTGLAAPSPLRALHGLIPQNAVVISPFLKRWLPDADVVAPFLPVGAGRPVEAPSFPQGDEPFRFLFLGAYEPGRGVENLVQAFHVARSSTTREMEITLAVNGAVGGTVEHLRDWVQGARLSDGVTLKGIVDTGVEYLASHALVIPRASETRMSFPVRLIEAAYWKRPVITTTACGMHELVQPDIEYAPQPGDIDGLARALREMATDPGLYSRAIAHLEDFERRFAPDSSLNRITELCRAS